MLRSSIIQDFENSFILNCLTLFGESYSFIREHKTITIDWEEENISAIFFDYIDKSEQAIAWNINIADEHRLYDNQILSGKKPAKTASRIDFRLMTNWTEQRKHFEFFIEAKNLIESDCSKAGRKTKVYAQKLHDRYIVTGIDNFVSRKYPHKGCLVGYVLQGMPENIVLMINACLDKSNRSQEKLLRIPTKIPNMNYGFRSIHGQLQLDHYLIKF